MVMDMKDSQPNDIQVTLQCRDNPARQSSELRQRIERMIADQRAKENHIPPISRLPEERNKLLPENFGVVSSEELRRIIHELKIHMNYLEIQNRELLASEERYRSLAEQMPSLICTFLPDSTLTYVNQAYCDYFGKHSDELTGKRFLDFLPDSSRLTLMQEYMSLTPANPSGASDHPVIGQDGTERWHGWTNRAFFDENGKILYFQAIGRDITERRQAEQKLLKAKETAQSATLAKSGFLSSMSHEIRTPLNAVINMNRLLLDSSLDEEQKDYAETAMISSELLLALVNDILDFSKIEAGKLELENRDFNLIDFVEAVVKMFKLKAAEKGLTLAYRIEHDVYPHLIGDKVRLCQIMINVLGNAIKFTHKGGITIRVSSENQGDIIHSERAYTTG